MTTAWILVIGALFALAVLVYVAVRNRRDRADVEEAIRAIRSIDIEAFRNLVDPNEEAFLRCNLPPQKFREIKRERAWAAIGYVWCAGRAAALVASVGHAAQRSSDPRMAASGAQIADNAVRLRFYAVQTCFRLVKGALLPSIENLSPPSLVDQYERTAATLLQLGKLRPGQSL
jgi:hypothetical protein